MKFTAGAVNNLVAAILLAAIITVATPIVQVIWWEIFR